jgi:hypothetical protein
VSSIESKVKESARDKTKELVEKFNRSIKSHYTEQDTITIFILPLLESLGWNIRDVDEVKQGGFPYHLRKSIPVDWRSPKHPDCVVLSNGTPHIVFEFKNLAYGAVDNYCQIVVNLLDKTSYVGAKYGVLTSFAQTVLYEGAGIVYCDDTSILYSGTKLYDASTKKYDCTSIKPLVRFSSPTEYLLKFEELWNYLSKEKAAKSV